MSDAKMVITGVSNKASRENCLTLGPINGLPTDFCSFLIFKLLHFLNNVFTVSELRLYFYLCGFGSTFIIVAPALLFSLWLRLYFSLYGSGSTFLFVDPALLFSMWLRLQLLLQLQLQILLQPYIVTLKIRHIFKTSFTCSIYTV